MKRSLSVTSINSTDSVIPIDIVEVPPKINRIQTRSAANTTNNSFNSNSTLNNSNSQKKNEPIVKRSVSPFSLVYIDSESASTNDTVNNKINDDDISSFASSDVGFSEKSSENSGDSLRAQHRSNVTSNNGKEKSKDKLNYKFAAYAKEDHSSEIYAVQIYNIYDIDPEVVIFATVGSNRCSVYEFNTNDNSIKLIDSFMDADKKENFFSCCWTNDCENDEPLLAIGGFKGVIRTILPFKSKIKGSLFGHGSSINELRIHPTRKTIILSASKDYTLRLWNLKNGLCVCVLGGCEGHRDEVLSADFTLNGSFLISCSIDHSLKMWNLNNPKIKNAICESELIEDNYKTNEEDKPVNNKPVNNKKKSSFKAATHHFPDYTTRDVHANYIDCVRWLGDLILSKSCENSIILWKPGLLQEDLNSITRNSKNVSIIHKFPLKECDIWYIRFSMDITQKILSLGTQNGKIYVWNLDADNLNDIKQNILTHLKCKKPIRSTSLSLNGRYLVAVSDDSHIWIYRND